jgi:hypothetical protein
VSKAIVDMYSDGSEITIASTAAGAGVHRSFIHRHPDLHVAVVSAAAESIENPSPAATTISHRSVLTENANLHGLNRRLYQRIQDLEDRLSEMLGVQAFERSGLDAPPQAPRSMTTWSTTISSCSTSLPVLRSSTRNSPPHARRIADSWVSSTACESVVYLLTFERPSVQWAVRLGLSDP